METIIFIIKTSVFFPWLLLLNFSKTQKRISTAKIQHQAAKTLSLNFTIWIFWGHKLWFFSFLWSFLSFH